MKVILYFIAFALSLHGSDYDCVFIGSSPVSIFEALYQQELGAKVLIVDAAEDLGGAWKSITICNVEHVDVGCHDIGTSNDVKEFLEVYGGCKFICSQNDSTFYFSKGCYELIHNLEKRIQATDIQILRNTIAERAVVDENNHCVVLDVGGKQISAQKVFLAGNSFLNIGDRPLRPIVKKKYYHLYLLVADPTPFRFGYHEGDVPNCCRMMNLTPFVGLENTGKQLIVFQTYSKQCDSEKILEELKKNNLLDSRAYILQSDSFVYEQWPSDSNPAPLPYFETLSTYNFRTLYEHFPKWKQVLRPYKDVISD